MLDSSLADRAVAAPTAACRLFSAFCLKLADAAVSGQDYEEAWGILRTFFDASAVQLLRHVALPVQALHDATGVHVLDASTAPGPLRALLPLGEGYGLLAVARLAQRRCDAVLVLRASPFSEAERAWMEMMLAHVRPALELGNQLVSSMPTVASAVHLARLIPTPCALIDEAGRCLQQNAAFGRIVEAIPGVVRDGRLVFGDHYLHKSWQQALLNADRTTTTQSLLATTPDGEQWKIHIVPFACIASAARPARTQMLFALFEKHLRPHAQPPAVLGRHPLTKAELEVLANLLQGHSAKTIARARGASVNTVRSQIATILSKTGHRSQKELIALFNAA